MIATNGFILIIVKAEYPVDLESKIIDVEGDEIKENFPNYNAVLPKYDIHLNIVISDLEKALKNIPKKDSNGDSNYLSLGSAYLDLDRVKKTLTVFNAIKEEPEIWQHQHKSKWTEIVETYTCLISKNCTALIMPCYPTEETKTRAYTIEEALTLEKDSKAKKQKWYDV